jgi:glycosylphosphatidylinositol transamidase
MAIALWMRTGYYSDSKPSVPTGSDAPKSKSVKASDPATEKVITETKINGSTVAERVLALPLSLVSGLHLLGLVPLWIFNTIFHQVSY